MSFTLLKKQNLAIKYLNDKDITEVLYGGAAGGGKSFLGCLWILERATKLDGTRWLIGRSKLDALKKTTLKTLFDVMKMCGVIPIQHYKYNQQDKVITFYNGSEIILKDLFTYPSDPNFDSLGSLEITGGFIDECNQVDEKAKNVVRSRIRYKLREYNITPKLFMTCNPAKGWVYDTFYKPDKDNSLKPYRKFIQALVTDNTHIDPSYIESLKQLDEASKQRLLYGNWDYDDDLAKLFPYDEILNAFANSGINGGEKYITADIARFGDDATVICTWNGWRLEDIRTIDKSDLTEVAKVIREISTSRGIPMSKVVCDENGLGGGVIDMLRCEGFVNNAKPLKVDGKEENYANLKSQCFFRLAKKISDREVFLNAGKYSTKISEELSLIRQKDMDKDGKTAVEGKDKLKAILGRSPDFADAIMMRVYFDLRKNKSWIDSI